MAGRALRPAPCPASADDQPMSLRIAVDTGGTFSDVVVTDAAGGELW